MKAITIIKTWLSQNGYDGLVNGYTECGCHMLDSEGLIPCEWGLNEDCEAAFRHDSAEHGWVMKTVRQANTLQGGE